MQNNFLQPLFLKNSLFKTAYLCKKNNLLSSLFKKQLIHNNLLMQNSLLGSLFKKQFIQNSL